MYFKKLATDKEKATKIKAETIAKYIIHELHATKIFIETKPETTERVLVKEAVYEEAYDFASLRYIDGLSGYSCMREVSPAEYETKEIPAEGYYEERFSISDIEKAVTLLKKNPFKLQPIILQEIFNINKKLAKSINFFLIENGFPSLWI